MACWDKLTPLVQNLPPMINNYATVFNSKLQYEQARNVYFRILNASDLSPTWSPNEYETLESKVKKKLSDEEKMAWFAYHSIMCEKYISNKNYDKYDLFKPNNIQL